MADFSQWQRVNTSPATLLGLIYDLPVRQVNVISQPGEPSDWVEKQTKLLEGEMDEGVKEMVEEMKRRHLWTRNITHPSTPPRYDPTNYHLSHLGFLIVRVMIRMMMFLNNPVS